MWKRIYAYVLGIPLAFLGVLYAYSWCTLRPARLEARKFLADVAARENALDSLGDIDLDPTELTLAKFEETLGRPDRFLAETHNSTRVGWACAGEDCEIWAWFQVSPGKEIPPVGVPAGFIVRDRSFRKSPHRISIGGIYLGESIANVKQFCQEHRIEIGPHEIIWDKRWKIFYGEMEGRITFLMLTNQDAIANHPEK